MISCNARNEPTFPIRTAGEQVRRLKVNELTARCPKLLKSLREGDSIAFKVLNSEIAKAARVANRRPVEMCTLGEELRAERVGIFNIDFKRADAFVLFRAGNQKYGDGIPIHNAEVFLLIIDTKAHYVAVVGYCRGNVVER